MIVDAMDGVVTMGAAFGGVIALFAVLAWPLGAQEAAPDSSTGRQKLGDAWWTGPILAPSAATLPHGHFLFEPYVYDLTVQGRFGATGTRQSATHSNALRSLTYLLYGVTDRLTAGLIPTGGYNVVSGGPNSSGLEFGDLTLDAQLGLTRFHEGSLIPSTALVVQETVPTGRYDRLGAWPSDGLGGGAYTTTIGLYCQTFLWLPTSRILRLRFNVSDAFSTGATVRDVSVYGTAPGFRGHAYPGNTPIIDAAGEYSITQRWVFAIDAAYHYYGNTRVRGSDILDDFSTVAFNSRSGDTFGFAPAIEYNWKGTIGIIAGTYAISAGRNSSAALAPVMAINIVR